MVVGWGCIHENPVRKLLPYQLRDEVSLLHAPAVTDVRRDVSPRLKRHHPLSVGDADHVTALRELIRSKLFSFNTAGVSFEDGIALSGASPLFVFE